MLTASSLAWKTSLRKVRTPWHCSRLRSVALYLWLIVVISVRQSTVAAISGLHSPGAGYGQFEHKADSLIGKIKNEAGGMVREIDVWAESPRLSPSDICIIVHVAAVNHYRDNAITHKAQRDKNARELKLANAAITDMQTRQRDVAALDAKIHVELADAKAENADASCVMMLPLVVVGCTSKQSVSQCVKLPVFASVMDNAASPDWQTPLNGIISPSERGWSRAKTTGRETWKY